MILQAILVAFQVPHLIQFIQYTKQGISGPIPSEYTSVLIHILFYYFVVAAYSSLTSSDILFPRLVRGVGWIGVLLIMVYGWRDTYIVVETVLVVMVMSFVVKIGDNNKGYVSDAKVKPASYPDGDEGIEQRKVE